MEKEKIVIAAASIYKEKYFVNPDFEKIPKEVLNDVKEICVRLSAKLHCIFTIGFYSDGQLYFESTADENDYIYDEIGAKLEIDKLIREDKKLITSLELWYKIFILKKGM